jgi:uncharacterized membrane protein
MIQELWDKIKNYALTSWGVYTIIFAIIAMYAWFSNALKGTHFDIKQLEDIYAFIIGQLGIKHGIDSVWNSPKDAYPTTNDKESGK